MRKIFPLLVLLIMTFSITQGQTVRVGNPTLVPAFGTGTDSLTAVSIIFDSVPPSNSILLSIYYNGGCSLVGYGNTDSALVANGPYWITSSGTPFYPLMAYIKFDWTSIGNLVQINDTLITLYFQVGIPCANFVFDTVNAMPNFKSIISDTVGIIKTTFINYLCVTTGIPDLSIESSVFPNPTDNIVYLPNYCNIRLYDMLGNLVFARDKVDLLNLESLKSGIYLLIIDGRKNYKIIKK